MADAADATARRTQHYLHVRNTTFTDGSKKIAAVTNALRCQKKEKQNDTDMTGLKDLDFPIFAVDSLRRHIKRTHDKAPAYESKYVSGVEHMNTFS